MNINFDPNCWPNKWVAAPQSWLALQWHLCYQLVNPISETVSSKTTGRQGLSPWLTFQLYQFVPKPFHDLLHQETVNHPGRSGIREKVQGTCAASAQLMSWLTHHFPRRQTGIVSGTLSICVFARLKSLFAQLLFIIESGKCVRQPFIGHYSAPLIANLFWVPSLAVKPI